MKLNNLNNSKNKSKRKNNQMNQVKKNFILQERQVKKRLKIKHHSQQLLKLCPFLLTYYSKQGYRQERVIMLQYWKQKKIIYQMIKRYLRLMHGMAMGHSMSIHLYLLLVLSTMTHPLRNILPMKKFYCLYQQTKKKY